MKNVANGKYSNNLYFGKCHKYQSHGKSEFNSEAVLTISSKNTTNLYPTYCKGFGYVLSFQVIKCINQMVFTSQIAINKNTNVNENKIDIETDMFSLTEDIAIGKYVSYCGVNGTSIKNWNGKASYIWHDGEQPDLEYFMLHPMYYPVKQKHMFDRLWHTEKVMYTSNTT